jgi:hypothetical protein
MTTIENNKLMMVFLGYEEIYSPLENIFELSENETILESDLTFHSDWNQLMKVVDKIESLNDTISSQHFTRGLFYTKMVFLYYMR